MPGGPTVGAFSEAVSEAGTIALKNGDTGVLFTDGVTEARNRDDEEFGEERLVECLYANHGAAPADMLRDVFVAVHVSAPAAEPTDDITVTVTPAGS